MLKAVLNLAPIMRSPDWKLPFRYHTNGSQLAVGGTLTKSDKKGEEHVFSFFSKILTRAEENHSTNDQELLGLACFLKRFRYYLEESELEVMTDN